MTSSSTKEERDLLLKSTEEKASVDLEKGRSTWVRRWLLVDLSLFSGLRVFEIATLTINDPPQERMKNYAASFPPIR